MEHAKKMMIVSPELIQRLSTSENAQAKILSQLDEDMQKVLTSKLSDNEKWLQYNQVLQRYLHFTEQSRLPVTLPIETTPSRLSNSDIIMTLPENYKKKAENLINILSSSGSVDWDNKGTVTIKGETLPSSNIIDLINDAIRPRKTTNPIGCEKFTSFMKEINIPHELIGNPRRRNAMLSNQLTSLAKTVIKQEDYDADSEGRNDSHMTRKLYEETPTNIRTLNRRTSIKKVTSRTPKAFAWKKLVL